MPGYANEMPTYTNGMAKYYGEGHVKGKSAFRVDFKILLVDVAYDNFIAKSGLKLVRVLRQKFVVRKAWDPIA